MKEFQRSSHCDSATCVEVSFFKSSYSSSDGSCVEVGFQKSTHCCGSDCVEVGFQKSTHSADNNCVEVGFHKSSYSANGECVEVGFQKSSASAAGNGCVETKICTCDEILVRDSKDREGPVLTFTRAEWSAFLAGVKDGEFELPPVA